MANAPLGRTPIILHAGDATCEIWPEAGGSIGRWAIGGQEMLRRASSEATGQAPPLGMATFPLIPYSNRIGQAAFTWHDKRYQLKANFPPELHAIHGTGWTTPWVAEQVDNDAIVLRLIHSPDAQWPWAFDAEQHIRLTGNALSLHLSAQNLSDGPVPLAFGHHPYFDSAGATLSFAASTVWQTGDNGLPAFPEAPRGQFDFTNGEPVAGRALDNGYAGWDGTAHIQWQGRPLTLNIEADMAAAVVYVPQGGDSFCFEPVPHIVNALNLPGHCPQMPVVAPGASFETQISFTARAARPIPDEQR